MSEIGDQLRAAFLLRLELWGEDVHAGGEPRKAVIYDTNPEKPPLFKFAEEFPIEIGDTIVRWATETRYSVEGIRPHAEAGVFESFQVTASEHSY